MSRRLSHQIEALTGQLYSALWRCKEAKTHLEKIRDMPKVAEDPVLMVRGMTTVADRAIRELEIGEANET